MKLSNLSLFVLSISLINARFIEEHETDQVVINAGGPAIIEQYLLELEPGKLVWATEEEKWELRRVCI